jgi:hypothetical protein
MRQNVVAYVIALACIGLFSTGANAGLIQFNVPMDGAQEVPGPGDPDGSGLAVLIFDDVANTVTWDIDVSNITLPIIADHIHQAPVGVAGPVVISFSGLLEGGPLVVDSALLLAILANPAGYYVNVHNVDFPAGAIRGQLGPQFIVPEPATLALLGLGLAGLGFARRRRKS